MNYCAIDGRIYDVIVTSIEESFTILYTENTGRTSSRGARMTLDPLGTFFSHKVTFKRSKENYQEFDELYNYLTVPRYDGMMIEMAHNQKTIKYEAYVSQGARKLQLIYAQLKKILWGELTINFVPMEAQVLPE